MSEIDISKCKYHRFKKRSFDNELIAWCQCENGACQDYYDDCHYKQLQQSKQENEEIRKVNSANAKLMIRLRDCLDEIEKVLDTGVCCDGEDIIRQLIEQAKEGGE